MIIQEKLMPNGTLLSYHKVSQVQITNSLNLYFIIVNSFVDSDLKLQCFQQSYDIVTAQPIASFTDMERVLTEVAGMPFYGGQLG